MEQRAADRPERTDDGSRAAFRTDQKTSPDRTGLGFVARDLENIFGQAESGRRREPIRTANAPGDVEAPRTGRRAKAVVAGVSVAVAAGALFGFVLSGAPADPARDRSTSYPKGISITTARAPSPASDAMQPDTAVAQLGAAARPELSQLPAPSIARAELANAPQQPALRAALRPAGSRRASMLSLRNAPSYDCEARAGYERAQCDHQAIMRADRRLRSAYGHARNVGVSSRVLANYNDRWTDLLEDAEASPRRVAAGYLALAGNLDRLAAEATDGRREDDPE